MSVEHLTIQEIKAIRKRLEWTPERKADGQLWLAEARAIRDQYGITDEDILRGICSPTSTMKLP